jgi:hypothetical protein
MPDRISVIGGALVAHFKTKWPGDSNVWRDINDYAAAVDAALSGPQPLAPIVALVVFQSELYVATTNALYVRDDTGKMRPVELKVAE